MMSPVLAYVIDDALLNWIIGGIVAAVPVVGTTIWALWRKLTNFMKPLVIKLFTKAYATIDKHYDVAETLQTNVPILISSITGQESLLQESIKRHGETSEKLDTIIEKIEKLSNH